MQHQQYCCFLCYCRFSSTFAPKKTARAIKPIINLSVLLTMTHLYSGLTALQVAANRSYFGANTLSHSSSWSTSAYELLSLWFVRGVLIVVALSMLLLPLLDLFVEAMSDELWLAFVACVLLFAFVALVVIGVAIVLYLLRCRRRNEHERMNKVRDSSLVRVVRDGFVESVPRMDIVVGDVILLGVGDEVPADALLLETSNLVVSEYLVNGQIECAKTSVHLYDDIAQVSPSQYVFCGSMVIEGEAVAQVFAVGHQASADVFNL